MIALFHLQGTSCTKMIVKHCHKNSTTGNFLQVYIEDLGMEVGMYNSLWKITLTFFSKYASDHSLIFHACNYNSSNKIEIPVPHQEINPRRKRDRTIMNLATELCRNTSILQSIQKMKIS